MRLLLRARAFEGRRRRWAVGSVAATTVVVLAGGLTPPVGDAAAPQPVEAAPSAQSAQQAATLGFQVQLGPEQRLIGPTGEVDVPYFSERYPTGKLFGVAGTSRSKFWQSANNARISRPRQVLDRGGVGKFDECGVWMMSIQKITAQRWLGFYHAESKGTADDCDHVADTTIWRMGLAETTNGGRTWNKNPGSVNYPNNVILTGTGTGVSSSGSGRHAGNGRVVKLGSWYYMFFQAAHGAHPEEPGVYVARAKVADQGMEWKKYYCITATNCGFTQPGIGGKATPITRISEKARYVSWNSYLKRWIGLDASGKNGFRLYASEPVTGDVTSGKQETALMSWEGSVDIYAPVSTPGDPKVDQWGGHTRGKRSKQLYAYPSILGTTEGPTRNTHSWQSGQTFYIYYMKLFPGDKFNARYLFRRKVTLKPSANPMNRVELTVYKDKRSGKRRGTTEAPKLKSFRRVGQSGFLLSHAKPGWKQVFECARRGDFALYAGLKCKRGWTKYRRVGWIRATKGQGASVPVFRCYDRRKRSHFVAPSPKCAGAKREMRIGFALRSQ
jgi:hypothetical protein